MHRNVTFENAIAFARDLVRIPSLSGEEGPVAARVMSELRLLRFDDCWCDGIGNVMARVKGKNQAPPIMLSSHLDIVDAGNPDEWEYPPFSGEIAEGHLHGRGAMDCKGPLALQTYAAANLVESQPLGDVYLGYTVFEEKGSWGMRHIIEHLPERPSAVVLGEATAGDICVGHRGRKEVAIVVKGLTAHASMPHRGSNPIDLVPDLLIALREFMEQLPSHEVLPRSTLAVTKIESHPDNHNMIPEEVRIIIDWRTLPNNERDDIAELRSFLEQQFNNKSNPGAGALKFTVEEAKARQVAYTGLDLCQPVSTDGFFLPSTDPLVKAAVQAVHSATGREPSVRHWTFGTDGSYSCGTFSIPSLGYAPGNEHDAHTNRERLDLQSARTVYDAYPTLIQKLQQSLMDNRAVRPDAESWESHLRTRWFKRT